DGAGNAVHLGERDCSLQRRHQKIWEEANSPALNVEQRMNIGQICADAMKKLKYRGAGTVEFLYENGEFYSIEMNTRLQVEHPVPEATPAIAFAQGRTAAPSGAGSRVGKEGLDSAGHALEGRTKAEVPRT